MAGQRAPAHSQVGQFSFNEEWTQMVRKFAAALVAVVIAFGSVFAEEVRGTFVKFADGVLTIKVDDKDKDYKIPADLKVKRKGKGGEEREIAVQDMLKGKFVKEGSKLVVVTEGDKVTDVKFERGRGKGKGKGKDKE
jgi:hypothetical protein